MLNISHYYCFVIENVPGMTAKQSILPSLYLIKYSKYKYIKSKSDSLLKRLPDILKLLVELM